ncbi:MAG: CDP-glycerol glycerophosphotransferase family protein [Bacilli bacterium]
MKKIFGKVIYYLFRYLPLKDIIIFETFNGKEISDSPKAIYDVMTSSTMYNLKWVINSDYKNINIDQRYLVQKYSIKWLYYLATSKVFIKNTGDNHHFIKRRGQLFFQTWHGIPIKKMGYDVDNSNSNFEADFVKDWDYLLLPNSFTSECMRSSTGYKGNIIELGYPRNDIFYNYSTDLINKIYKTLDLSKKYKYILYAPTFREEYLNDDSKLIALLNKMTIPKGYKLLIKLHPLLKNTKFDNTDLVNVCHYDNIYNLMIISDCLITDYSSVMFDYLNLRKPIILFTYDLKYYQNSERGFYFDITTFPGIFANNIMELKKVISNFDELYTFDKKFEECYEKFCKNEDGNSAKRCSDFIISKIENRRKNDK